MTARKPHVYVVRCLHSSPRIQLFTEPPTHMCKACTIEQYVLEKRTEPRARRSKRSAKVRVQHAFGASLRQAICGIRPPSRHIAGAVSLVTCKRCRARLSKRKGVT